MFYEMRRQQKVERSNTVINSNAFDYIDVLDKAADASYLRHEAITNNIANATTPNYKRQDVSFESELERALTDTRYTSMDEKVSNATTDNLSARTYTDYDSVSYRLDGNNVDIETENVMMVKNQIKYNALLTSINEEFSNLKSVMK